MRIRTKLLIFFLPLLLVSVGLIAYLARQAVQEIVAQEVVKRGVSIATSAAENPDLLAGLSRADEAQLLPRLQNLLDNTETLYAMALNPEGRVVAHTNVAEKGKVYTDSVTAAALSSDLPAHRRVEIDGSAVMDVALPVWQAREEGSSEAFLLMGEEAASQRVRAGTLRLGLPMADALDTADRISLQVFWIIVLVSALGLLLSLLFSRRVLAPIQALAGATERLGRGALGETAPVMSNDELGDLAKSFNRMSRDLAETTVSKDFLNRIQDNMVDVMVVTTADRTIQMANRSTLDLLGFSEEDLIGRPLDMLFPEENAALDATRNARLTREGGVQNVESSLLSRSGRRIPILFSASALYGEGDRVEGFILTARDITERKQMEEALRRARDELEVRVRERTAELNGINESLKREIAERKILEEQLRQAQKMEAVGRLAGGVAHDFNNNLGIIQGYVEMILARLPEDSPLHSRLGLVRKAVQRSVGLTDQLLIFSRRKPVDIHPMDLNRHVEDLQKMLGRLLSANITVRLDLADNLWFVKADSGNLDQVITNLCVNAHDAMPEGGVLVIQTGNAVIDEAYCQTVPEARPGRFVRLSVIDTGTGMDGEVLAQIFEPFFTTKGPGSGTGLGLSVVYGIVQAHEGWITVESRVGRGSRFDIYLPAAEQETGPVEAEADILPEQPWRRGQGECVLLVEDEAGLREMMEEALADAGYRVVACSTAASARAAMEGSEKIDLVLSDVVLPDGRGTDLVFAFRKARPDLSVLLVTGYADAQADWERVQSAGLVLLQKPVPMPVLLEHVHEALRRT